MTCILGIDPGLTHTGWGVIHNNNNTLSYIACGRISSNTSRTMPERLCAIHYALQDIIHLHNPTVAAVEETFVNKNPQSSLKLGHARGSILLSLSMAKLTIRSYAPRMVKQAVVGTGKADKHQISMMVKQLLPNAVIESEDAADALAIALCHEAYARNPAYA